jgi:hypothetical protein
VEAADDGIPDAAMWDIDRDESNRLERRADSRSAVARQRRRSIHRARCAKIDACERIVQSGAFSLSQRVARPPRLASPPALRSRRVRAATALAGLVALGVGYARQEYRAFTKASLALLVAAQLAPVVFDAV